MRIKIAIALLLFGWTKNVEAQMVPSEDENIPFLINFGPKAKKSFGDDDYKQAFFFVIPSSYNNPFFIRIFDPGVSGKHDEQIVSYDTKMRFSFFGGDDIYSTVVGTNAPNISETESGDLLREKEFGNELDYDDKWYTFGPFNPTEGEFVPELEGYVFKMLGQGISGDDGNAYKYFLTSKKDENLAISGANAFTFEYTVRLHDSNKEVTHLYPFVDSKVMKLKQHNFDLDAACEINIYSVKKVAEKGVVSGDNVWSTSFHKVYNEERESCMDFQIVNNKNGVAKNNNVVLYITNQYGEYLPFMAVPIGEYTPKKKINVKGG